MILHNTRPCRVISYPRRMASKTSAAPSELALFHRNPKRGDVPAIEASLLAHDQYRPIVVNKGTHTGRPMEVLVGNHTLIAIRNLAERYPDDERWRKVAIHVIDVDDDRATRIVLADNRTAELGGMDEETLGELLSGLGGELEGTGYSSEDLDDILALGQEGLEHIEFDAKKKGQREDGLVDGDSVEDCRDVYADQATRLIILNLPIPQFIWAQGILERYREATEVESNAEALLTFLSEWSGEVPPAADAELEPVPGTDTAAEVNPFAQA